MPVIFVKNIILIRDKIKLLDLSKIIGFK